MDIKEILSRVDHTLLNQAATFDDIRKICDDGIKYQTASVCIPPCFVKAAKEYVGENLKICTVIGFPNGYNTASVKCAETAEAVKSGADEIDMVINIGDLRAKNYEKILSEINLVKENCSGKILKVIIETCLLSDEEKIKMCEIISKSNADFIKTSTGFAGGGATFDDIKLFKKYCAPHIKIKAAGGISSIADAEEFINLGADRLGTSKIIKLVKEQKK
ncbi:MAG: deoxyribose-phosphate aldolase [Clostridiales bacterium]|nr:deoxyribose-phosphate aldolase [Candidatus Equinaster intestinalis]